MTGDAPSPGHDPDGPGQSDHPQAGGPWSGAAPLALYRRYRPASFAEVKGQDHVTEPLRQALRSGRVHHAYLFSGPRGCGKTSSARILARSLNCEQGPTPDPCGVCASCVALAPAGPGSIDVIEIDAASHGGVDDARDLRERAFYAPVSGRFKIYIIDEAHMVTREGFNALLKLVEEPPPHLKFVFATTEPEKVIPTIRSRTHHYPFRLVPPAVLREHLEQILDSEGVPYEPSVLPVVIRAGAGSVRDALSVLDQLVAGSDESGLRHDRAIALLGYTDDRLLDEVIEAFAADDGAAVFHAIDHVAEAGHDPRRFAADLLDRLRDLIVISAVPDAASTGLIDAPADRLEQLAKQAASCGRPALTRAAEIISAGLVEMRGATSPRLLLELMCAQVLLPPAAADTAGLADRLDRVERELAAGPRTTSRPQPAETPHAVPGRPGRAPAAAEPSPRAAQAQTPAPPAPAAASRAAPRQSAGPRQPAAPSGGLASEPGQSGPGRPEPGRAAAGAPAGADALRARWPDVLEAVQGKRRVAWMQLSHASVESFADNVLTLAFAQAGVAKGFLTGGYDADLGQVLQTLFGITPVIRTEVLGTGGSGLNPGAGTGPPESGPPESGPPESGPPESGPSESGPSESGPSAGPGAESAARAALPAAQVRAREAAAAGARGPRQPGRPARPAAEPDPEPSDPLAPDVLTGTGLIERELGGRIIQELDEPQPGPATPRP